MQRRGLFGCATEYIQFGWSEAQGPQDGARDSERGQRQRLGEGDSGGRDSEKEKGENGRLWCEEGIKQREEVSQLNTLRDELFPSFRWFFRRPPPLQARVR